MDEKPIPENLVRFGVFEVDLVSEELRKSGVRLRLGGQPFQVLALLLRTPGKIVKREDLKQELWANDTFVDFENGVNTAIRKIRRVLDDSADTPRYIETLPRRGYRFIGPVEGLPQHVTLGAQQAGAAAPTQEGVPSAPSSATVERKRQYLPWLLFVVTAIGFLALLMLHFRETPRIEARLRKFAISPPVAIRGSRMPSMVAISPDGKHIAFVEAGAEGKLWVQDLDREQPRAIEGTEGATGPFWSPGSDFIGFAADGELKTVPVQGGPSTPLCKLPSTQPRGTRFWGGPGAPMEGRSFSVPAG